MLVGASSPDLHSLSEPPGRSRSKLWPEVRRSSSRALLQSEASQTLSLLPPLRPPLSGPSGRQPDETTCGDTVHTGGQTDSSTHLKNTTQIQMCKVLLALCRRNYLCGPDQAVLSRSHHCSRTNVVRELHARFPRASAITLPRVAKRMKKASARVRSPGGAARSSSRSVVGWRHRGWDEAAAELGEVAFVLDGGFGEGAGVRRDRADEFPGLDVL